MCDVSLKSTLFLRFHNFALQIVFALFQKKRDRNQQVYTQFSYESGSSESMRSDANVEICETQNDNDSKLSSTPHKEVNNWSYSNVMYKYKTECKHVEDHLQKVDDTDSVSQREHSKILSNHYEMLGNFECKDTEYCPLECKDTNSVSRKEYSESLPNHFEALENMAEETNRESAENTLSVEATVDATEDVSCGSLQDNITILTKKESETSDEAGTVLSEANEGHASEKCFQAEDNDEAEPKMANQD